MPLSPSDLGPYTAGTDLANVAGAASARDARADWTNYSDNRMSALRDIEAARRRKALGIAAGAAATAATLGGAALLAPAVAAIPATATTAAVPAVEAGNFLGLSAGTLRSLAPALGSMAANVFGEEDPVVAGAGQAATRILGRRDYESNEPGSRLRRLLDATP